MSLKVALIQSDLHWRSIDANLAQFEEKIWQVSKGTDLIILPEMFTTGFTMEPKELAEPVNGKTYRWIKQQAEQSKSVVMGSAIIKEGGSFFNRLLIGFPDGKILHYDKKHLFTLAGEDEDFESGNSRLVFEWNDWKIMPLVCYDLRFPVWSRSSAGSGDYEYDLLVYCANWPKPRIQAWDKLLAARAIENQSYTIGVNRVGIDGYGKEYSGHTAAYDFFGNEMVLSESEEILELSLSKENLEKYRKRFPFQADADDFSIL